MNKVNKSLSFLIIFALVLTMVFPVSADTAKTTKEKAQVLNNLKIISGTNGEFSLNNQVRRAEAVTFILKTMGKGNEVELNKALYMNTPFLDVASNQWYAPFIGYAYNIGLITKTESNFKPLDFVTEKDFLKLVLIALGYRENTDFTADSIYYNAIEKGLISLNDYVNGSSTNKVPTRGYVVDILYKALKTDCREGGKLFQKLIDQGIATRAQLLSWGLVEDTVSSAVSQVKVTGIDSLQVTMNEAVASVSGIRIFLKTNENDTLACSITAISGSTLIIKTAPVVDGKEYVIELTNVMDNEGNTIAKLQKAFTGSLPQEVNSDFFRISKIDAVNERSLKVFFTHPVSINSEVCLYYTILKDGVAVADGKMGGLRAGLLNSNKTGVLLSLDSSVLKSGELYTLRIDSGMMSAYGVRMNDGKGDEMKFVARSSQDIRFALSKVAAIDKKTLELTFSKEVNPFLVQQIYNFYLTDVNNSPMRITSTTVDPNGSTVFINLAQDMEKGKKYNLTINNLNDITKQEYITEETSSFTADFGASAKFEVNGVHLVDNQTIEIFFNRPLDKASVIGVENCAVIKSGIYIRPDKVLYTPSVNPNMLTIYLSKPNRLSSQNNCLVQVNGVKDNLGNSLSTSSISFIGIDTEKASLTMASVIPISSDAVKVSLSSEIAYSELNLVPSNFTLEYTFNRITIKKAPISILYVDAKTLILKFDALESATAYTLSAASLTDLTGATVKGVKLGFELTKQ